MFAGSNQKVLTLSGQSTETFPREDVYFVITRCRLHVSNTKAGWYQPKNFCDDACLSFCLFLWFFHTFHSL